MPDTVAELPIVAAPAEVAAQPVPERVRDVTSGRFVKTVEEGAARGLAMLKRRLGEAEPAEEKHTDVAQAVPVKEPARETGPALEADLQTLRFTGLKSKHLEKFSHEEIHEIAEHERKRQADNDTKVARANEAIREREAAPAKSKQPEQGPAFDLDAAVQPLVEEFGSEAASKFGGILKAIQGHYDERISKHEEYLEILAKGHWSQTEERARTRLAGRYPQVVDDDTFQPVKDKADQLFAGGSYESLDEAYADAAAIKLGKSSPTKSDSSSRYRANGQPAVTTRSSPPAAMDKDKRVVSYLHQRIYEKRSVEDARRIAGSG